MSAQTHYSVALISIQIALMLGKSSAPLPWGLKPAFLILKRDILVLRPEACLLKKCADFF